MLNKLGLKKVNPKETYLHVVVLLDNSGSMSGQSLNVRNTVNSIFRQYEDGEPNTITDISLYTFGYKLNEVFRNQSPNVSTLNYYNPTESTALDNSLGELIERLEHEPTATHKDHSYLVVVVSDGDNTDPSKYTRAEIRKEIKSLQDAHNWTFTVYYNKNDGNRNFLDLGFSNGNTKAWEVSEAGLREVVRTSALSNRALYSDRSRGVMKTSSYFATTDLSKVDIKDVHSKLDDLSNKMSVYEVKGEDPYGRVWETSKFAESKTKRAYVTGQVYYQLTKKETVQSDKEILLMEKGKKAIWGGDEARKLIGLNKNVDLEVTPGNHSNYDIFVQSKAPNRKLPRGTKVIIDNTRVKATKATWEG